MPQSWGRFEKDNVPKVLLDTNRNRTTQRANEPKRARVSQNIPKFTPIPVCAEKGLLHHLESDINKLF